jgi:hypothetical protein
MSILRNSLRVFSKYFEKGVYDLKKHSPPPPHPRPPPSPALGWGDGVGVFRNVLKADPFFKYFEKTRGEFFEINIFQFVYNQHLSRDASYHSHRIVGCGYIREDWICRTQVDVKIWRIRSIHNKSALAICEHTEASEVVTKSKPGLATNTVHRTRTSVQIPRTGVQSIRTNVQVPGTG